MNTKNELSENRIRIRLRTKLLVGILLLEAMLMSAVILVVEDHVRASILAEFLKRGVSVTRNLAAINSDFVATYNYVKIEQNLERVTTENGLLYSAVPRLSSIGLEAALAASAAACTASSSNLEPINASAAVETSRGVGATAPIETLAAVHSPPELMVTLTPAPATAISISERGMNLR